MCRCLNCFSHFLLIYDIVQFIFLRETSGDFETCCLQQCIVLPCYELAMMEMD